MQGYPLPTLADCNARPGKVFMDSPVPIRNADKLGIIDWAFPLYRYVNIGFPRYSVNCSIEVSDYSHERYLYCGLKFDNFRTNEHVIAGANSGITFWSEYDPFHPSFDRASFPIYLKNQLESLADELWPVRSEAVVVRRVPGDDRNLDRASRTRVLQIDSHVEWLYSVLHHMRQLVNDQMQAGVPHPLNFHFRCWGAKWYGRRYVANQIHMGFWNPLQRVVFPPHPAENYTTYPVPPPPILVWDRPYARKAVQGGGICWPEDEPNPRSRARVQAALG